jgi:hypothetical protein
VFADSGATFSKIIARAQLQMRQLHAMTGGEAICRFFESRAAGMLSPRSGEYLTTDVRFKLLNRYGILVGVTDNTLNQLCVQLRDAQEEESIRRAAEALRNYLHHQQRHLRERLLSDAEKAFSQTLDPQLGQK